MAFPYCPPAGRPYSSPLLPFPWPLTPPRRVHALKDPMLHLWQGGAGRGWLTRLVAMARGSDL